MSDVTGTFNMGRINDQALLARIARFNGACAKDAHESWVRRFYPPALGKKLLVNPSSEARLSNLLKRAYDLDDPVVFDKPIQRFALLEGEPLNRVAFLTGIALHADEIRSAVARVDVLALKNQIGADAWRFAVTKADFLLGRMSFPRYESHRISLRGRALASGVGVLAMGFAYENDCFVRRVQLKLPIHFAHLFSKPTSREEAGRAWQLLRKVLLQEVDPSWAHFLS